MRTEEQTSMHLLLAVIVSVFSVTLIVVTATLSWEPWMVPLVMTGCFSVWCLHIGNIGTELIYENLCVGVMLTEFFFFGVHSISLYDIPAVVCIMILVFSMFDRKWLLYLTAGLYVLVLLYHFVFLHTIHYHMELKETVQLALGLIVMVGAAAIARYRIDRRKADRRRYDTAFAELEKAGRQNAEFLSNVSHELRTPINMVLGISEVTLGKDVTPEIRTDMQSIQLAGKRLSNQINNMLDYTEISEGTLIPTREEYMITSVLNDMITMTAIQGSRYQLEMVFDINPKTPAVLVGDAEKISHVLKIILENAIKFTEEGGINVCIEFRRESYGINLVIDIYDTGIGMTNTQLTQIYDDFYQADSGSSRFAGGLGLGIPIARGLLHAMGGFVHFESKGMDGLHAHIVIPQGVADDTPCIMLPNADELCIACYFRPEKYSCDEVRSYYDKLIASLVEGLGIEGYQAHNFDGLKKLLRAYKLTHVFIAQSEYEENHSYYEELAASLRVVLIAEREYNLSRDSRLMVIHKPFSALSVANLLNGEAWENGFEDAQTLGHKPFSCEGVRALAVDDEEMNLVVAKGVLGSYGIEVDTCLGGREAVEKCQTEDYDIIFLDHMMPGFDGVETLRFIREMNNGIFKDLPVIALTANTISGAREMFRVEGFTEFIPKPIERSVLERVLRRVLPEECIRYGVSAEEEQILEDVPAAEKEQVLTAEEEPQTDAVSVLKEESAPEEEPYSEDIPAPEEEAGEVPGAIPYAKLEKAGINVKMGLDYCCGEEEFYLEMLRMFHSQSAAKEEEIISLYETANWTDYAVKVHALKSTSLTVGAEELSAHAKTLELAGKQGDIGYIRENHARLLRMYEEVSGSMAGL